MSMSAGHHISHDFFPTYNCKMHVYLQLVLQKRALCAQSMICLSAADPGTNLALVLVDMCSAYQVY